MYASRPPQLWPQTARRLESTFAYKPRPAFAKTQSIACVRAAGFCELATVVLVDRGRVSGSVAAGPVAMSRAPWEAISPKKPRNRRP